jgi:hypothetical protein
MLGRTTEIAAAVEILVLRRRRREQEWARISTLEHSDAATLATVVRIS